MLMGLQRWGLLATIVVAAVLFIVEGAQSQRRAPRRQDQNPPQQTQQNPTPDQRGTEQAPLVVRTIPGPTDEAKAAEEAKDRREKAELDRKLVDFNSELAFYTKILAGFAGLQFIALLVQAYWLARTVKVSETAARAARQSADAVVAQLRAYVGINSGSVTPATVNNAPGLRVHVELKNSGITPAFDFTTWIKILVADKDAPPPFTEPIPVVERGAKSIVTGGASVHINWSGVWAAGDLEKVRAGIGAIFVWGGCDYRDAFQNPRSFIFRCMMSGPEDAGTGWALKPHPTGYEGN